MRQTEQRLPHATEAEAKLSFAMGRGPTAKHHPAWNPHCTQWFRAEDFPLLCPTPNVMPRFSLGDVGEARWPLSHRWTDSSSILPDAAHDSRNQGCVVSLFVLSLPPTLSAARGSPQLAASAESLVTDPEHSNRRVTCMLHKISDVTHVHHAQGTTLPILRALIACAAAVLTAVVVPLGPSCLGHYKPLQRSSASGKYSVRYRPFKQRDKTYRNF